MHVVIRNVLSLSSKIFTLYEYATISFIRFTIDGHVSIWGLLKIVLFMETLGSDGYVHYLDCGDGLMGVYICPNHQIPYIKYVYFFACQLYLNEAVKKQCCC